MTAIDDIIEKQRKKKTENIFITKGGKIYIVNWKCYLGVGITTNYVYFLMLYYSVSLKGISQLNKNKYTKREENVGKILKRKNKVRTKFNKCSSDKINVVQLLR